MTEPRPYFPGGRPVRALVAEEFRPDMTAPAKAVNGVRQPPADDRCEACGYLLAAIGHKVTCGDGS